MKHFSPFQRDDGYYETVFNFIGKTYRESSATALIAAGWMNAVRKGWLDPKFAKAGVKAFNSVCNDLRTENNQLVAMAEISGPTIPTHIFPYLGYKIVPRGENYGYGLAGLIFAAIAHEKLCKTNLTEDA